MDREILDGVTWGAVLITALIALMFGLGAWLRGRARARLRSRVRPCPLCGGPTTVRLGHLGTYAQWVCDQHGTAPMVVFEGEPPESEP